MTEQIAKVAAEDSEAAGTTPGEGINTHGEHDRRSWSNPDEGGSGEPDGNVAPSSGNGLLADSGSETAPNFSGDPSTDADPSQAPSTVKRPDHVPKQFWDEAAGKTNEKALATSYNDLRKQFNKMTQESGKAPEDFEAYLEDFKPPARGRAMGDQKEGDLLERYGDLDPADPVFKALAKAAKFANLDKGKFTDFTQVLMEEIHEILPEPFSAEKEMSLLGEGGEALVQTNKKWVDGLASRGVLNENMYNLMLQFGSTAQGVMLTNALRIENGEKPIPVNASVATGKKTPDECAAMMNDKRFYEDGSAGDAYRAEVEKEFALTHGTEPEG